MMSVAFENLDRRVLAGFRTVNAAGQLVRERLIAQCDGAALYAKRPGEWVIQSADVLPDHHLSFDSPPAALAIGSQALQIDLRSLSTGYLSRRFALRLPRDPDPANRGQANSLFRWQDIVMPFDTASQIGGHAAAMVVTVQRSDDQRVIEGAVVRIRLAGGLPERISLTNTLGEALLVIPAVPLANSGGGASVTPDLDADVDAIIDPALVRFHAAEELVAAQQDARLRDAGFIDPDDVVTRLAGSATAATSVKIAGAQRRTTTINWSPP